MVREKEKGSAREGRCVCMCVCVYVYVYVCAWGGQWVGRGGGFALIQRYLRWIGNLFTNRCEPWKCLRYRKSSELRTSA